MNRKLLPAVAAFLVLLALVSTTPLTYAVTRATIGPKLEVITIAEDDQVREKGIIILGLFDFNGGLFDHGELGNPTLAPMPARCTFDVDEYVANAWDPVTNPTGVQLCGPQDLLSQHKLLVTYNGQTLKWRLGDTVGVPAVFCNVIEKDKVNVVPDAKSGKGKQFDQENLMTKLVDTSDKWVCKPRWKSPVPGTLESAGVLDVYYVGPFDANWIADYILVVEVSLTIGRTVIFGSEIQDICVLGVPFPWIAVGIPKPEIFTKPFAEITSEYQWLQAIARYFQGTHFVFVTALGPFTSCEDLALIERQQAGIPMDKAQDPLAPA